MSTPLIMFRCLSASRLCITYWAARRQRGAERVLRRGTAHYRLAEKASGGRRLYERRLIPGDRQGIIASRGTTGSCFGGWLVAYLNGAAHCGRTVTQRWKVHRWRMCWHISAAAPGSGLAALSTLTVSTFYMMPR